MKEVIDLLEKNKIDFELVEHEEVHTIDDMEKLGLLDKGYACKNLFLRNANGKMNFVFSCLHNKDVKLNEIEKKIGSTRLSFGSADRLQKYLKLENGYVSPFGVINDDSKSVIFVFDKELQAQSKVGFHPNTNKATVYLKFKDLEKIILDHGNDLVFVKL